MTMQMFNLFACKTRLTLPFGRYMFANRVTFYSILGGAALTCLVIYTPGVETVFKTVTVYKPDSEPQMFTVKDELTAEPHLPGFRVHVSEMFE